MSAEVLDELSAPVPSVVDGGVDVWSPLDLPPTQPHEQRLLDLPAGAALLEGMRRMEVAADCSDHCRTPDVVREGAYLLALAQGAVMNDLATMESAVVNDHFWKRHAARTY